MTDDKGRFRLRRLRPGEYLFKVTRSGFQSVVGRLTVSKAAAAKKPILIELPVGV
jgi:hypothetical protein